MTGLNLQPFQTRFSRPELADPYLTVTPETVLVSGTAQYHLKFDSIDDVQRGGPFHIVWNDFFYADGTPMEGDRFWAHSWDMKPVLWSISEFRIWDENLDYLPPLKLWYGGHMRPEAPSRTSKWPDDNYSRDVFAFSETSPGRWQSTQESIFAVKRDWPRTKGNFLGHRYGHQIVMMPRQENGKRVLTPVVFYEEVTQVREDGFPKLTEIFMNEMVTPYQAKGNSYLIASARSPTTGLPFPSTIREDGSVLMEGPLYFRFNFESEEWEAVGFSSGSFYGNYTASFASRKVADGLEGRPFLLDLNDEGSDLHNAGRMLGDALNLAGGPGRPAVFIRPDGSAILGRDGRLQVLVHAYRKDILPDNDYTRFPVKYRLNEMFRIVFRSALNVKRGRDGALRFDLEATKGLAPKWTE